MEFFFDTNELSELMHDFYILTHIRIVLFDADFNPILAVPADESLFCSAVRKRSPGDQSERIKPIELMVNDCCELYSKSFIKKLCEVYGTLDPHYTYRLTGKIVHTHNMAVFSLETLTPVEM